MLSSGRYLPLIACVLSACGPAERPAERAAVEAVAAPDSASLARARAAADGLGRDLVALLTSELQRGGPAAAIAVCADSAQARTARHSVEGVTVRRVGTRVRNSANAPDPVERAVLAAFAVAIAEQRPMPDTAFVTPLGDGTSELRYLRAIRLQEPCLACHGAADTFSPAVRALLRARYPDDRAIDYAVGELRGAISVRVDGVP